MYVYVLTRTGGGERRAEDKRMGRRERREKEGKEKGERRKEGGEGEEGRKRCWYSLILMFPTVQFLRMQKCS